MGYMLSAEFGAEATHRSIRPVILADGIGQGMVVPHSCAIRAGIAGDYGGRLMLTLHRTVLGLAQFSDAFGGGPVGGPCRAFCNGPF